MYPGCTVTHIGGGLALTAGHCFDNVGPQLGTDLPCGDAISFGVRDDREPTLVTNCDRIVAAVHADDLDYAVIRLHKLPPRIIPLSFKAPVPNEAVTIFSHPGFRPLEWSGACVLAPGTNSARVAYACDTEPGSSGAAVIDTHTRRIIAVHNGFDTGLNAGTPTKATAVRSFLKTGVALIASALDPSVAGRWYAFANDADASLATLDDLDHHAASFDVEFDLEDQHDFVLLEDGSGHTTTLTGSDSRTIHALPTPINVRFKSDGARSSDHFEIYNLVYE
jgi:hypothetical protein